MFSGDKPVVVNIFWQQATSQYFGTAVIVQNEIKRIFKLSHKTTVPPLKVPVLFTVSPALFLLLH